MTYKIGATIYDADNMLWETKIGTNNTKMTLLYSAWGKTEAESVELALHLLEFLEK